MLAGKLGAAFVRGVQSEGVAATVKHLAGNEGETDRFVADSVIDERTLREVHLRAFEIAVREGGALAVMTSYNRLNGSYCADDRHLLDDVLRGEWGFDGLVMSDWFAIADTERAIAAGLDLEMPGPGRAYGPSLAAAVEDGRVAESAVDTAAIRVLTVLDRIGALDDEPAEPAADARPQHRAVAREAAAAGMVLLQNDGVLPLVLDGVHRLAVLGPNADRPTIMGGGSASLTVGDVQSPLAALRDRLPDVEVLHEAGDDTDGIERAVALASGAGVVVVVVGTDGQWESEGHDRTTMALSGGQDELVRRVLQVAPDAVVVLNTGAPVALPWIADARAVLQCWFGGQEMGPALVDVLLGDVDPAGRLPTTFPVRIEDNPSFGNFPAEQGTTLYGERISIGHRWYEARGLPVVFPFGHGLSYTTFEIGEPALSVDRVGSDGAVTVTLSVTNTGDRRGSEVVQVYVGGAPATVLRPPKWLAAFAKVTLDPGGSTVVELVLDRRSFARWQPADEALADALRIVGERAPWAAALEVPGDTGWVVDEGTYTVHVGRSSADLAHSVTVEVAGGPA